MNDIIMIILGIIIGFTMAWIIKLIPSKEDREYRELINRHLKSIEEYEKNEVKKRNSNKIREIITPRK